MTDTRAKLETLFRRLTDPAISDLEALSDFVWFRKLALGAKDVAEALGTLPDAVVDTPTGRQAVYYKTGTDDGPMWPFKKKHAGESIASIARTDPDYLRFMLKQDYIREPLKVQIRTALGLPAPAPQATNPPTDAPDSEPPF